MFSVRLCVCWRLVFGFGFRVSCFVVGCWDSAFRVVGFGFWVYVCVRVFRYVADMYICVGFFCLSFGLCFKLNVNPGTARSAGFWRNVPRFFPRMRPVPISVRQ